MPTVCSICCEEIFEATRPQKVKKLFCVMAHAKNGSTEDALGFTRRITEP